jgi:hypothetical protein
MKTETIKILRVDQIGLHPFTVESVYETLELDPLAHVEGDLLTISAFREALETVVEAGDADGDDGEQALEELDELADTIFILCPPHSELAQPAEDETSEEE